MAGYYRRIKGKNYDRELLDLADASVSGKGDGRISMRDARALLAGVKDADSYTEIEKRTIKYIRENYKFTKEADALFRKEIRSWAALRGAKARGKVSKKSGASARKKTKMAAPPPPISESLEHNPDYADISENERGAGFRFRPLILILLFLLILLILLLCYFYGCFDTDQKRGAAPKPKVETTVKPEQSARKTPAPESSKRSPTNEAGYLKDKKRVESIRVPFEFKGSGLSSISNRRLGEVAAFMKKYPGRNLRVIGHTCNLGTPWQNNRIGEKRARASVEHLVKAGITRERLSVESMGEKRPIASNRTWRGRVANRRVQFVVK